MFDKGRKGSGVRECEASQGGTLGVSLEESLTRVP